MPLSVVRAVVLPGVRDRAPVAVVVRQLPGGCGERAPVDAANAAPLPSRRHGSSGICMRLVRVLRGRAGVSAIDRAAGADMAGSIDLRRLAGVERLVIRRSPLTAPTRTAVIREARRPSARRRCRRVSPTGTHCGTVLRAPAEAPAFSHFFMPPFRRGSALRALTCEAKAGVSAVRPAFSHFSRLTVAKSGTHTALSPP